MVAISGNSGSLKEQLMNTLISGFLFVVLNLEKSQSILTIEIRKTKLKKKRLTMKSGLYGWKNEMLCFNGESST